MGTHLNIDQELLKEAHRVGGKKTKRETVNEALEEYIRRRRQQGILQLFGRVQFHPSYDHKCPCKQR